MAKEQVEYSYGNVYILYYEMYDYAVHVCVT